MKLNSFAHFAFDFAHISKSRAFWPGWPPYVPAMSHLIHEWNNNLVNNEQSNVTTPPQYGRNRTAHAAGASILSLARGVCDGMSSAWHCVRWAWWITGVLPLGSATHFWCCHSNATCAPIANPPNSAQLGGICYHSAKLHPGPCNSVGMWPRTDRHTDTRDHNTFRVVYDSREM